MSDPWIRVHANIASRPVIWKAMETLGIRRKAEAVGLMTCFWGQVSQHCTNGVLNGATDAQIEEWAGWEGKRGAFAEFIRSKHLDGTGRVNEWDEYHGKLEARRKRDRDRKAAEKP